MCSLSRTVCVAVINETGFEYWLDNLANSMMNHTVAIRRGTYQAPLRVMDVKCTIGTWSVLPRYKLVPEADDIGLKFIMES